MIETTKGGKAILRAKIKNFNGSFGLYLRADKAIENFFEVNEPQAEASAVDAEEYENTQFSSRWALLNSDGEDHAMFYRQLRNPEWGNFLNRYGFRDSYGSGFEKGFNLALLRTKGISKGITLVFRNRISLSEVEDGIKAFGENVKTFYQEFLRPINVEMVVRAGKIKLTK